MGGVDSSDYIQPPNAGHASLQFHVPARTTWTETTLHTAPPAPHTLLGQTLNAENKAFRDHDPTPLSLLSRSCATSSAASAPCLCSSGCPCSFDVDTQHDLNDFGSAKRKCVVGLAQS